MDYEREYKRLQQQIEDERNYEAMRRDQEYQERENSRRQARRASQEAQLYAESWDEAFNKGIARYRREAAEEKEFEESAPEKKHDHYFQNMLGQAVAGREEYEAAMREAEARIQRVHECAERLIAAIEQKAREQAAAKVDAKFPNSYIGQALRDDDFMFLVNW